MFLPSLNRRRLSAVLVAPVVALALTGCATTGQIAAADPDDQAALLKRAQEYWNLVKNNDRIAAWKYEVLSQEANAGAHFEGYLKRSGVAYNAVEAMTVEHREGDLAVINVKINYSVPLMRITNTDSVLVDHWRLIDGVWYHAPAPKAMMQKQAG